MATGQGRLKGLSVEGFKSVRKASVEFRAINLLIGPNGAGKSNLIEIFKLLNRIVEGDLQIYTRQSGGADRLLHFGQKTTDEIGLNVRFSPNSYKCILTPGAADRLFFKEESCTLNGDLTSPVISLAKTGDEESGLRSSNEQVARCTHRYMKSWKIYHFHDTSNSAAIKKTAKVSDCISLRSDAANLSAILYRLKKNRSVPYNNIVEAVRQVAPFFGDFNLEPEPEAEETIRLRWRHGGHDNDFDVGDLSDGTLRFMCLATLLLQPAPADTILLDEPELGLHPHAIQLLAGMMRSASERMQIIASTQSVTLANQFTHNDVIVADREDDASVFRRLAAADTARWLEDYGIGDLWEKDLIGGTP